MSDNQEQPDVRKPPSDSFMADFYEWHESQADKQRAKVEEQQVKECLRLLPDFEAAFLLLKEVNNSLLDQSKIHDITRFISDSPVAMGEKMIRELNCKRENGAIYLSISEALGRQNVATHYVLDLKSGGLKIRIQRLDSQGNELRKEVEFSETVVLKASRRLRERRDSLET